ncbi:DUF2561 family protein [Mycobacterium sp. Y57]|uniref:DUF2561 family protein n=1 Tax=Mycolicibacterium xanthum TaxID=2796469 RepID=UPI001C854258|nr:DUF2561 family protein [Mycolicibacterium xanthum]MBX7431642.1 DUF2561 family protein [Mycolicibacterium xanthum]
MTHLSDTANRPAQGFDLALDRADRILLGGCAAVWLAALGAGVAAVVALVDLARGHTESADSGTPWVLYTVIGVSAAVIVAAVPLLMRARRASQDGRAGSPVVQQETDAPGASAEPKPPARGAEAPTEKIRIAPAPDASGPLPRMLRSAAPAPVSPAVEQLLLRGGASLVCAMGVATLLIGVSTYLMAVGTDTAAWVLYVLAGIITVGMAAIPWYFVRELDAHVGSDDSGD